MRWWASRLPPIVGACERRSDEATRRFPRGWNAARVARVLAHYEQQPEDEAVAEDEAAFGHVTATTMRVPVKLVPKVRELIAKQRRRGRAA